MKLTNEQNWLIVCAPSEVSSAALARSWGLSESTVTHARIRIQRHGWTCPVTYGQCLKCGEWLTNDRIRQPQRRYHPACREMETQRISRRHHERRWAALDQQTRERMADRASEYVIEAQSESHQRATNHGAAWSESDDAILIKWPNATMSDLAQQLGRTYWAIHARRKWLKQRGLID